MKNGSDRAETGSGFVVGIESTMLWGLALLCLTWFGACSPIRSHAQSHTELRGLSNYSWGAAPAGIEVDGAVMRDANLLRDVKDLVDAELSRGGLRRKDRKEDADVLLRVDLFVTKEFERADPVFTTYTAREFERGALRIRLLHLASSRVMWDARAERRLRVSGTLTGLYSVQSKPTKHRRDWQISRMIEEALSRLQLSLE